MEEQDDSDCDDNNEHCAAADVKYRGVRKIKDTFRSVIDIVLGEVAHKSARAAAQEFDERARAKRGSQAHGGKSKSRNPKYNRWCLNL